MLRCIPDMYQLYSPLLSRIPQIMIALHISANDRKSRASLLVTANYVSERNSRANRKFSRARTSTLLRSSSPFSLRAWPTIRKINLYLKFPRCAAPRKGCTGILNVILTVFTSLGKKLSQFTFSSSILLC